MYLDVINKRLMIFYFIFVYDQDEYFIFIKFKFFMKVVYFEFIFINKIY